MNKKKGFTLIELLAVIVILAVIALISAPLILGVIENSKVGALKDSAYGLMDAAELYLARNMLKENNSTMEFVCSGEKCISGEEEIKYKGKIDSGKIRIYADNEIELCINDDDNAALKTVSSKEITLDKGTCNFDKLGYGVLSLVSKNDYDNLQKEFDEYKAKFNTVTTATASDIVDGKTSYDNLGNLILGTKDVSKKTVVYEMRGSSDSIDLSAVIPTGDYTSENFVIDILKLGHAYYAGEVTWGNVQINVTKNFNNTTRVLTIGGLRDVVYKLNTSWESSTAYVAEYRLLIIK